MATIAELRKAVKTAAALLTGNLPSRGTSNMKKAELESYLAEYTERLDKARAVNGAYEQEAARVHGLRYDEDTEAWVPFGPGSRLAIEADDMFPSGDDRLSANDERDDEPDFYAEADDNAVEVEATNDADADAELMSFMRTVVEAPSLPADFPVTETDVAVAEVYVVVQLRGKLYDGKLIAVVNRRTTLSPAFLVTVELEDGIRRLVRADHTLAA